MLKMSEKRRIAKEALGELRKYDGTISKFFAGVSEPFQIDSGEITKRNLWKILLLDVQSRGGPKLNVHHIKKLRERFFRDLDLEKAKALKGEGRFQYLYNTVAGLPRIGPKITSVFMRNMVCEFSIFPELKDHLFLPIDVHIENVLVNKLRLLEQSAISKDNPVKTKRAKMLQQDLSEIHNPRVELDDFWWVGYLFCNKKSQLVCAETCWIREYCQEKYGSE